MEEGAHHHPFEILQLISNNLYKVKIEIQKVSCISLKNAAAEAFLIACI